MARFLVLAAIGALSLIPPPARALEPVRGVVRAVQEAWLTTELNARVTGVSRREGEAFVKGEVLITFDCDKYRFDLEAARAEETFHRIALENSVELDRRKAIGRFEVAQNRSRVEKATAQAEMLAVRVRDCRILAPFDGRVAEMKARTFETATPNQPLMRLVGTEDLEIELIVPSGWLRWLKEGHPLQARIDETETEHGATVARIAPMVDAVSQTVKIIARFARSNKAVLPGMSLSATFPAP